MSGVAAVTERLDAARVLAIANTRHGPEALWPLDPGFETQVSGGFDRARDRRELIAFLKALRVSTPAGLPSREQMLRVVRLREAVRALAEGDVRAFERRLGSASEGNLYKLERGRLQAASTGWDGFLADLALAARELSGSRERLKICANVACSWLFLDTSPSNRQVYCVEQRCGVRVRVRRFRLRRRRAAQAVR